MEDGCWLSCIGRFTSLGGFRWRQNASRVVIHVIHDGNGTFHHQGQVYSGRRGEVMVFFPGMHIRYQDDPARPWRYSWLVISGRRALQAMQCCGLSSYRPWTRVGDYPALSALCTRVAHAYSSGEHGPCFPVAAAWACLDAIAPQPGEKTADTARIAEACREWIESQPFVTPSVADIAEHLGVSRSTLFRAFKSRYGRSPKTHLDECRLGRAVELLEGTQLPIAEIAHLCGYRNPDYFATAFRRAFGVPPSQRREGGS